MRADVLLQAQDIHKTYRLAGREIPVLRGIDLAVHEAEMVALLGASGAGKSTLLHILGLLDPPTSGHVLLRGAPVDRLSPRARARVRHREIGFVFQFYHLIPELTALQNVQLGQMMMRGPLSWLRARRRLRDAARAMLARVGLADREDHRPSQLSGGERQRVAIARALIERPSLILADEPTGNLDSKTAAEVLDLLFEINRDDGLAFLLVTHNEQLAARCDRIVRIRDGQLLDGVAAEVAPARSGGGH